jgi:hypothetical protein
MPRSSKPSATLSAISRSERSSPRLSALASFTGPVSQFRLRICHGCWLLIVLVLRRPHPDFAPSSETPDVAPSSKLRKAMSGKPGGYVGQDFGELSRVAVLEGLSQRELEPRTVALDGWPFWTHFRQSAAAGCPAMILRTLGTNYSQHLSTNSAGNHVTSKHSRTACPT